MFLNTNNFVFLSPFTTLYSHERIPKNKAPQISSPRTRSLCVKVLLYMDWKTCNVRHFWCLTDPSWLLYPRTCLWMLSALFPGRSRDGSLRKSARKLAHMWLRVAATVVPRSCFLLLVLFSFLRTPARKAEMRSIRSLSSSSSKCSSLTPHLSKNLFHQIMLPSCFCSVCLLTLRNWSKNPSESLANK